MFVPSGVSIGPIRPSAKIERHGLRIRPVSGSNRRAETEQNAVRAVGAERVRLSTTCESRTPQEVIDRCGKKTLFGLR